MFIVHRSLFIVHRSLLNDAEISKQFQFSLSEFEMVLEERLVVAVAVVTEPVEASLSIPELECLDEVVPRPLYFYRLCLF